MSRKLAALFGALVLCLTTIAPAVARPTQSVAGPVSAAPAAPASAVDQTKVPHYFGPYPNWANSPLTLPDATVTIDPAGAPAASMTVGNPLIARQYASDDTINTGSNTVGQGTVFVLVPGGTSCRDAHELPDLRPERSGVRSPVSG